MIDIISPWHELIDKADDVTLVEYTSSLGQIECRYRQLVDTDAARPFSPALETLKFDLLHQNLFAKASERGRRRPLPPQCLHRRTCLRT